MLLKWIKSSQELIGKQILPMVEVVVSRSGSCEPMTARPKAKGLAVPRIREVPERAIALWVMDIISGIHGERWSITSLKSLLRTVSNSTH